MWAVQTRTREAGITDYSCDVTTRAEADSRHAPSCGGSGTPEVVDNLHDDQEPRCEQGGDAKTDDNGKHVISPEC